MQFYCIYIYFTLSLLGMSDGSDPVKYLDGNLTSKRRLFDQNQGVYFLSFSRWRQLRICTIKPARDTRKY